jgi:hypothetical protein
MIDLKPILDLLDQIINDRTVPKNIRGAAEDSKNALNSKDPLDLKVSTAIHNLDEIINDPNMPMYARTKIWNIVSMLERVRQS